ERFRKMHEIFPSHRVARGDHVHELPAGPALAPRWQDDTSVTDYMAANHIAGVIVLVDGRIHLEEYAPGVDENTLWTSFSVAKSITSLLLGVALDEGHVDSLDDPLADYIPALADSEYARVTVRELLTMTSGVAWDEDYADADSDVAQMYMQPCERDEAHIVTYMKDLPRAHPAGTRFNYSTGETDLLGILIEQATGLSLAEYLSGSVWRPFGMAHEAWWLADECDGSTIGGSGLSATLSDYARLGQFMLDGAELNGEPVVAGAWHDDATRLLQPVDESGDDGDQGYGYLWWINADGSYQAAGIFGQLVHIDPARQLVIAQIAAWPEAGSDALVAERRRFVQAVKRSVDEHAAVFVDEWQDD
ncbi:MAG TPA: serine hydrolase domain-containing protein, partial [Wenzhouxiangella sp.]|nr:serine hydrolase domain-containing protein [Wenzhouxiangella sp.]